MIITSECLEQLKKEKDYSADIILSDPPYFLGSKWKIDETGNYVYEKHADFMNEWSVREMDGYYWNDWFKEAYRITKHGSPVIMFSIDRQQDVLTYYARKNGFDVSQSLYWVFISSFPKASDVGKMLDKREGAERKIVGKDLSAVRKNSEKNHKEGQIGKLGLKAEGTGLITAPSTDLAKKYDGWKYSVAPLKQICETILVFRKPVLNSPLDDLLAYENGDEKVFPVCVNIDETRVPLATEYDKKHQADIVRGQGNATNGKMFGGADIKTVGYGNENGRYTPQLIIQDEISESMDEMSGKSKSTGGNSFNPDAYHGGFTKLNLKGINPGFGDEGGMSKVFPKIKYYDDIDVPYYYCPKVSKKERDCGLEEIPEKDFVQFQTANGTSGKASSLSEGRETKYRNNHPTVKPVELITWILKLFCSPDKSKIKVLVPFSGSGSELIACELSGVQYKGIEINPEYVKIAEARLEKAKKDPQSFINMFKKKETKETKKEKETLF